MAGAFSSPKIPGPSAAQVEAQESQARLAAAEEARLRDAQAKEEATRRMVRAGGRGRSLLLVDDVGITDEGRAPKGVLGG